MKLRKREYVPLTITRSDINKIMMLKGDYKAIEYLENIIMSKVIYGTLHNSYAELTMWMTGITDG